MAFATGGVAATAGYAADLSPAVSGAAFALVGIGCVTALLLGPRWHHAEPRAAWAMLAAASATFLIGALLRPWAADRTGATALLADAFTIPGYVFIMCCLIGLLRARGSIERHAIIDGVIVCLGAGLASTLLLAVPAASIATRPAVVSALAGLYPLVDVVLLLLLANLAFTTAARRPSYRLLMTGMVLVLTGDLAYAVVGASGELTGSAMLDLPFLLAYTAIGAAALHPSVVDVGRARPVPVQAWSWQRLMLIIPALAVPFVLITVGTDWMPAEHLILAAGGAAMVALLVVRAVSAVQDYAAAQLRYEHQATHDPLTGLPNRWLLSAHLTRLLASPPAGGASIWVFFLDLDGFKLVNDSWGHEAGDLMIIEVAHRLRAAVPHPATVARVGGDEFVLVHLGTEAEALDLVGKIMECLRAPLQVRTAEAVVSASIGIAGTAGPAGPSGAPGQPATAESLMRDADTAMYQAKTEGRGKWTVFDASMHERVRERVEIELALRQALSRTEEAGRVPFRQASRDELHLAYQPIVELSTAQLIGAEALLRWDHPERGAIPPSAFIPVAEDTGLVSTLGTWVLREALRQLAVWRSDGTVTGDFWMSINVSPRQLRDLGLPHVLAKMLLEYGVPATAVVLEITESVMVDANGITDQVMRELRELGARIVVDDFGTGFSALGYLRRHPVTGVKIDQAFVGGLGANAEDEEIVRAVVAMSTALGLTVVAEGVETHIQRGVLGTLGVVLGQGQLWGAAVGPARFAENHSAFAVPGGSQAALGNS